MTETLPATPLQHLQLLASEVSSNASVGVIALLIKFDREVPLNRLNMAWADMLGQHPGLRVRFTNDRGEIWQQIRSFEELPPETRTLQIGKSESEVGHLAPFGAVILQGTILPVVRGCSRLLVQAHHALVDEESLRISLRTFTRTFTAGVRLGKPGNELPCPDYPAMIDKVLAGARQARSQSRNFWTEMFAVPVATAAPLWGRDDRTAFPERPGQVRLELDQAAITALRAGARVHHSSVAILLHAALSTLMYRYGLGTRLAIGTPVSLRDHPGIGFDAVGLFLNVLPVVTEISEGALLRDVIAKARSQLIELHEHKFTPLTDVIAIADANRSSLGHSAASYFGVVLAVHDQRLSAERTDVSIERYGTGAHASPVYVDVVLGATSGSVTISWREEVIPWPDPALMARQLLELACLMGTDGNRPVVAFPLLDGTVADEAARKLNNGLQIRRATYRDLAAEVADICHQAPRAVAIADQELKWTNRDLMIAVGRARSFLRSRRLEHGACVGVAFGRSRWQVAFALAAWREGMCYVPVDIEVPSARLRYICTDAALGVLIGNEAQLRTMGLPCPVAGWDSSAACGRDTDEPADEPAVRPPLPDDVAYVMYTSGSSGVPKGVAVAHRNLVSFFDALSEALPMSLEGPWLAETSPTFDISFVEMFWPLTHGQTVILSNPAGEAKQGSAGLQFAHRQCTPSRARQVINARELGEPTGHWWVHPRTWLIGGEALPVSLLRQLQAAFPQTTFINMYGPTEATIWSTYHPVASTEASDVPLGQPLGNTLLFVQDAGGFPATPGVPGELVIAGCGVAREYLNRADQTAAAFTTVAVEGRNLPAYRSGDRVIVGPGHQLYFLGRKDNQIKLRGHRIELGEIEQHLATAAGVAEAVAFHLTGPDGGEIAAAVTARLGALLDPGELRSWLSERLPPVMVPSRIGIVSSLPRLSSGKLDRAAFAQWRLGARSGDATTAPPSAVGRLGEGLPPLTGALAAAVSEIVGRPAGPDDDFFAVGGNSLSALRLVAYARERGVEIQVRDVFEWKTIRRMATRAMASVPPTRPVSRPERAPALMLPMQAEFFEACSGDFNWFLTPILVQLADPRTPGAEFAARITQIMRQHDSLSASFEPASGGEWVHHLGGEPTAECQFQARSSGRALWHLEVLNELQPMIDIRAGRPVIARLVEDEHGAQYLFLLSHHLVLDALSLRHILQDVSDAVHSPDPRPARPEAAPIRAVLDGMRRLADSAEVRAELPRWRGLPLEEGSVIPVDRPGAPHHEATSSEASTSLGKAATTQLTRLAQRAGIQVGDLVATAVACAALTTFDRDVIVIDRAIHGRDLPLPGVSVAEAIGWLAVNVPIVLDRARAAPQAALEYVREQLLSSIGRGHGYSLLKHMASDPSVRAPLSGRPRPSISCNYLGHQLSSWPRLRRLATDGFLTYDPSAVRSHLFDIDCLIVAGELRVQTGYGNRLFETATAEAYLRQVRKVLHELIGSP